MFKHIHILLMLSDTPMVLEEKKIGMGGIGIESTTQLKSKIKKPKKKVLGMVGQRAKVGSVVSYYLNPNNIIPTLRQPILPSNHIHL